MRWSSTSSELSAGAQATNAVMSGGWCSSTLETGGRLLLAAADGALPPREGDGALAGRGDSGLDLAPLEGEAAPRRLRPLATGEAGGVPLGERDSAISALCNAGGGCSPPLLPAPCLNTCLALPAAVFERELGGGWAEMAEGALEWRS